MLGDLSGTGCQLGTSSPVVEMADVGEANLSFLFFFFPVVLVPTLDWSS